MDSLYKLVQNLDSPPSPLLVSPATLLSLVDSVIDLLVEQQISATLWLKVPPGKIWLAAIERYHQQVNVSHPTYICHTQKAKLSYLPQDHPITPVQLASNSQMRRDYFLLVLSPQFCSLILTHRSRFKRHRKAKLKQTANSQKVLPILSVFSFEERIIQGVLDGLKQAIAPSPKLVAVPEAGNISTESLTWDSLFVCPPAPQPVLLQQLLTKQIQQQDVVRRNVINERIANLQRQNQELQDALSSKDESFSSMCQELRTPLTHMKAALSLLNSPHLKPPQRQRYLQVLSTECDRQNSLINGLLELIQIEKTSEQAALQPLQVSDVVPGVVSTYQPLAQEKGVMLAYTVPTDLPPVSCSTTSLRQIVINLLHNSIKFTPTGGQVWVRASVQGDYVQLEFRDTGIGIPTNEIPRIFDRFYRVRSSSSEFQGGAGLGLTIVQRLLLRCGGSISVNSRVGEGSTFNVLLRSSYSNSPESR